MNNATNTYTLAATAASATVSLQSLSRTLGSPQDAPLLVLVEAARDVYYSLIEDLDEEDHTHRALLDALNSALEPFE